MYLTEDDFNDSELKINNEFNNCPGGKILKEYLDKGVDCYDFVDVFNHNDKTPYWLNDEATIVIGWLISDHQDYRGLEAGKVAIECHADEFDYITIAVVGGKKMIVRMWWD